MQAHSTSVARGWVLGTAGGGPIHVHVSMAVCRHAEVLFMPAYMQELCVHGARVLYCVGASRVQYGCAYRACMDACMYARIHACLARCYRFVAVLAWRDERQGRSADTDTSK